MNRPPMPRRRAVTHPRARHPNPAPTRSLRAAVLTVMVAVTVATTAAPPMTDQAAGQVVAPTPLRGTDTVSRGTVRAPLPVQVPADAVWELDDGGMLAELTAAFSEIEAQKAAAAAAAEAARLEAERAAAASARPAGSVPDVGSVKAYASDLVGGGEQWGCLEALWQRESGWNHLAENRSSGAYGIPQALPGSKMASAGADWATNPITQVNWGVSYINGRYGTPCDAWAHSEAKGWY